MSSASRADTGQADRQVPALGQVVGGKIVNHLEAETIAIRQLEPGEHLHWTGLPKPGTAALAALPGSLPGVPFIVFAVFTIWSAARATGRNGHPGGFLPLVAVPLLLLGVGMCLAPLWAWMRARNTVYAATDRRALIIVGGGGGGVTSHDYADIEEIVRMDAPDGTGSVFFGWRSRVSPRGPALRTRVGFIGITEARGVERLMRDHIRTRLLGRAA